VHSCELNSITTLSWNWGGDADASMDPTTDSLTLRLDVAKDAWIAVGVVKKDTRAMISSPTNRVATYLPDGDGDSSLCMYTPFLLSIIIYYFCIVPRCVRQIDRIPTTAKNKR
jgi:hypothetical protein